MIDITLSKLKYRNPNSRLMKRNGIDPPDGTWVFSGGSHKATSSNSGTKAKRVSSGWGHRRRAYGPF